jgi:ribosomal protein S18 acetylase RimI-like enzyme
VNNVTVERLQPSDTLAAAAVLSHAFLTQPNAIAVWGRQDEYARRGIETVFRIAKLERPISTVLVARRDGQIAGALNMTEWPRCQLSPLEKLRLLPLMLRLPWGVMSRSFQLQSAWGKHDPQQRHWHLGPLGVLPQLQRLGIGSRMLEKCCEIVDQKKDAAYLETDRPENVPFYERFGFAVIAEEQILGVRNWFMWRSPH